ncbi:MAG: PAS domain S-box protein [Bacteroidetes bacterium]|nr:MAG: PAS domain S-box protein [Bacteroidota bacterium]
MEDLFSDVEILKHHLTKSGIPFTDQVVKTEEAFIRALQSFMPDIILSDYALPQFDGLQALTLRNELAAATPFILVTGSTNEEIAVKCMKAGADDYLIKDNLNRLAPAILTAIEKKNAIRAQAEAEEALRKSENKYRTIFENIRDVYYIVDPAGLIRDISPSIFRCSGYTPEELIGTPVQNVYYSFEDRQELLKKLQEKGEVVDFDVRLVKKDGQLKWGSLNMHLLFDEDGNHIGTEGSLRDITVRKRAEQVQKVLYNISNAVATTGDTGKGIPPEKLNIIFERFRQVEENEYHEGDGLGLSISEALVKLLGGEIRVVSEVGKGQALNVWKRSGAGAMT